jgi:flagellar biosynthesis protein
MTTRRAVALRYEHQSEAAPRVVAKGTGEVAAAIVRVAQGHHVPLHESEELAEALMRVEVDAVIPQELYEPVAQILAFLLQKREEQS